MAVGELWDWEQREPKLQGLKGSTVETSQPEVNALVLPFRPNRFGRFLKHYQNVLGAV